MYLHIFAYISLAYRQDRSLYRDCTGNSVVDCLASYFLDDMQPAVCFLEFERNRAGDQVPSHSDAAIRLGDY